MHLSPDPDFEEFALDCIPAIQSGEIPQYCAVSC